MSLKVKDALSLEYLDEFKLITDESGYNNIITTVGILDHEMVEDLMHIFVEGEFVLSTFSNAKDDIQLVIKAIKALISKRASGLAIKTVYYNALPDEIITYANQHHFPIFTFHPSIYIEHLIRTVFNGIKNKGSHQLIEAKLEVLFSGNQSAYVVKELAYELNKKFKSYYQVIYFQELRLISEENTIRIVDKFNRLQNVSDTFSLFQFRNGIVGVLTYDDENDNINLDINYIFNSLGLISEDFQIGKSMMKSDLISFDDGLRESYYAFQTLEIRQQSAVEFSDIGLYRLLMPLHDHPWANKYMQELLAPILSYDKKYNTVLFETLDQYFKLGCKTQLVASSMFQHKNTILSRINKAKELTGPYSHDFEFFEAMSVALRLYHASVTQSNKNFF